MTETLLSNRYDDAILGLRQYSILRRDRVSGNDPHGGILLAIRSNLKPYIVNSDEQCEV